MRTASMFTVLSSCVLIVVAPASAAAQTAEMQEIERLFEKWRVAGKSKADKDKAGKEPGLEDLLQEALKHNAEIRQAEAQLRQAEAALGATRLAVLQKVVQAYQKVAAARASVDEAAARVRSLRELLDKKVVAAEEHRIAEINLQRLKAELARAQAEIPFLLGQPREFKGLLVNPAAPAGSSPRAEHVKDMARFLSAEALYLEAIAAFWNQHAEKGDRLVSFLETPIKVEFAEAPLSEVLKHVQDRTKGINLVAGFKELPDVRVTLSLREAVPLAGLFQLLEDRYPVRFVVREYGIVACDAENVPSGAVSVLQLWRSRKESPKK